MSDPVKMTKSGDVLQDEKGTYATCIGCKGRLNVSIDKNGEFSGTCKVCGCHVDGDKDGIWGVAFLGVDNGGYEE